MLRIYIIGFAKPKTETRYGDMQYITDGEHNLIIDGYCDYGREWLLKWLKRNSIKEIDGLMVSHWHDDHFEGIEKIINDDYFTVKALYCYDPKTLQCGVNGTRYQNDVKSCINDGNRIINAAKKKGINVVFLSTGSKVEIGDIKFSVWRKQPQSLSSGDTHAWEFMNDGSLCTYFPDMRYLTTGDGPDTISDAAAYFGQPCTLFKIPHHGNNCTQSTARAMKNKYGAKFAWYNDLEPNGIGTEDFTQYGAKRCKEAGIIVIDNIGDINVTFCSGKATIYHGGKEYTYAVPYNKPSTLKDADPAIVKAVFENHYGKGDGRITGLLDAGYDPSKVQSMINRICTMAADIKSGKVNYGNNEARYEKIDQILGAGYAPIVQKQINVLYGITKW